MRELHRACLVLGSNLEPEYHLCQAVEILGQLFRVEAVSEVWQSSAVGGRGPDFLNAALILQTGLNPIALKFDVLRPVEAWLGRVRTADKNAPRTIDIDIVAWDAEILDDNLWRYAHLAVPVAELLPCYQSASGEYLEQAARRLARHSHLRQREGVLTAGSVV
jgi:2-amino-4-hydroxy-6-hydroxymethyldihydropteridine diphosphokinase